jgi:hypothetical protein
MEFPVLFLLFGLAVFAGLVAVGFGGRVLIVAVVPRAHFQNLGTLFSYAAVAGIATCLAVWLFSLSIPGVFA